MKFGNKLRKCYKKNSKKNQLLSLTHQKHRNKIIIAITLLISEINNNYQGLDLLELNELESV
jgi:hypothetical protein